MHEECELTYQYNILFWQLFQVIMSVSTTDDLIRTVTFVICHLIYMFWINYVGQKFIDHDTDIYKKMQVK